MQTVVLEITSSGDVILDGSTLARSSYDDPESEAIRRISQMAADHQSNIIVNLTEETGSQSHHMITEQGDLTYLGEGFSENYSSNGHDAESYHVSLDEIDDLDLAPPQEGFQPSTYQVRNDAWTNLGADDGGFPDVEQQRLDRVRQAKKRVIWNTSLISIAVISILFVLWIGFIRPPSGDGTVETQEIADQREHFGYETQTGIKDTDLPGYDTDDPAWEIDISSQSALVAHDVGMAEIAPYTVHIYDPQNGKKLHSVEIDEPGVDFLVQTEVGIGDDTQRALAFKANDTLYIWSPEDDKQDVAEIDLEGRSVNDSGTGLLIYDAPEQEGDDTPFWYVDDGKLHDVEAVDDEDVTLTALDDGDFIYTNWSGTILRVDQDGEIESELKLSSPHDHPEVARWVAVGHDRAVMGWTDPDDETFIVAVHDLQDGSVLGTAEVSETVLDRGEWQRGQGSQLGLFDYLVFDMEDGALIADGSEDNIAPDYARGQFTSIGRSNDNLITNGRDAWSSQLTIVGVTDDELIVVRERGQDDNDQQVIQAFRRLVA